MNRHLARFLGYTLGYLFVVTLGRISDAVERQAEEERERVALWLTELQTPTRRPSPCVCTSCQRDPA